MVWRILILMLGGKGLTCCETSVIHSASCYFVFFSYRILMSSVICDLLLKDGTETWYLFVTVESTASN